MMADMDPKEIVRLALREAEVSESRFPDALLKAVEEGPLKMRDEVPEYSSTSKPLSLVRFRCLLQDTSYPAEVYHPGEPPADPRDIDWSQLKERWVGWAVEIPGHQDWAKRSGTLTDELSTLSVSDTEVPAVVKDKFPVPSRGENYQGALLKVYGDFSPSPASVWDVVGILTCAPLPTPYGDDDEPPMVPAIHALFPPAPLQSTPPNLSTKDSTRQALLQYLASAFSPPDIVAAELLLVSLLARPVTRADGVGALGTLNVNFIRRKSPSTTLEDVISSISPAVLPLPLTIPLLHESKFRPASEDGTSLTPGVLQLGPGTVLLINEDTLGEGGNLSQAALKNLQALGEALEQQIVRYEYPFTDGVRIECALRGIITSEGKTLLPVDVEVPVRLAEKAATVSEEDIKLFRAYIASFGAEHHATTLTIPDEVATAIQDGFVAERKASGAGSVEAAEARLKRRMKIARVLALSHGSELTSELWSHAVELDGELEQRLDQVGKRPDGKLGAPTGVCLE